MTFIFDWSYRSIQVWVVKCSQSIRVTYRYEKKKVSPHYHAHLDMLFFHLRWFKKAVSSEPLNPFKPTWAWRLLPPRWVSLCCRPSKNKKMVSWWWNENSVQRMCHDPIFFYYLVYFSSWMIVGAVVVVSRSLVQRMVSFDDFLQNNNKKNTGLVSVHGHKQSFHL